MTKIGLFIVSLMLASSAAVAAQTNSVRNQFTPAQWQQLQSLRYASLVLPAYLPRGFHVVKVHVNRLREDPTYEDYEITYGNGSRYIVWDGANFTAGGDPPPESFNARFNSRLFGPGIVTMVRGVALDSGNADCWTTSALDDRGNLQDFAWFRPAGKRPSNFMLQVCDARIPAGEAARMMESATVVRK